MLQVNKSGLGWIEIKEIKIDPQKFKLVDQNADKYVEFSTSPREYASNPKAPLDQLQQKPVFACLPPPKELSHSFSEQSFIHSEIQDDEIHTLNNKTQNAQNSVEKNIRNDPSGKIADPQKLLESQKLDQSLDPREEHQLQKSDSSKKPKPRFFPKD